MFSSEEIERQRYDQNGLSLHSDGLGDITHIFDKYKQQNTKMSPLPLNQFSQIAYDDDVPLLSMGPQGQKQSFLPFKQLNVETVAELQRSFQQSKLVWNSYSNSLFKDNSHDEELCNLDCFTQRKLQLYHNKETLKQIRLKAREQHEEQLREYYKIIHKLRYKSSGVRIFPSLAYQDQQKLEQMRKLNKIGASVDVEESIELQRRITESNVALSQIKKQIVYCYKDEYCYWGPNSRIGSTVVSFDHKLYLYGGAGSSKCEDLCYATTDKQMYKWIPIVLDEKPTFAYRVHHSASVYRSSMVVFGGELHIVQSQQNQRVNGECTSDIKIISLMSFDSKIIRQTGITTPRKCHISEIVGKSLLIHGGIDNRGIYLKDIVLFDMISQKWSNVQVENNTLYSNGVAFHKSCAVLQNKQLEIYRSDPELKLMNQGIYIFGGQDKSGNYLDKLVRINVYQKPISLEVLQTKGIAPMARSQHSMTYIDLLSIIVIYGGKNDDDSEEGFLNDVYLLEIKNLNWINVEIRGAISKGRCGHCSTAIDSKLFIFGGYNYDGFIKSDLMVLELDNSTATQLNSYDVQSDKQLDKNRDKTQKISFHEHKTERPDRRRKLIEDISAKSQAVLPALNFQRQQAVISMFRSSSPTKDRSLQKRNTFKTLTTIREKSNH